MLLIPTRNNDPHAIHWDKSGTITGNWLFSKPSTVQVTSPNAFRVLDGNGASVLRVDSSIQKMFFGDPTGNYHINFTTGKSDNKVHEHLKCTTEELHLLCREDQTYPYCEIILEGSKNLILGAYPTRDHEVAPSSHPSFVIFSGNDPALVPKTEWMKFYHDGNHGQCELGKGNFVLKGTANMLLGDLTLDSSVRRVLGLANAVVPQAAPENGILLYSQDSGEAKSTLALYTEQTVAPIGSFTPTDELKIRVNETEYTIPLKVV